VIGLARSEDAAMTLKELGAEPLRGRVEDESLWTGLPECRAIVHSAALVYTSGGWGDYQQVNVDSTRLAARQARSRGIPLVHISSVAVYADVGNSAPGTVDESAAIGSLTEGLPYPRSKRLAEQALWEECARGLKAIALRPCVVYGEGDRLFLPNLIRRALRGWFPQIGDGQRTLPMVYAGNVAQAVVAALESGDGWGQPYNVTNDDDITGAQLVSLLSQGIGRPVRAEPVPRVLARALAVTVDFFLSFRRSNLPGFSAAVRFLGNGNPFTSARARQVLGWAPAESHRDALPRSVRAVLER
jgi:nucleoside-diphosphate-sugar epimerase